MDQPEADEQAYHDHLDQAATESLEFLRKVVAGEDFKAPAQVKTARFILQLHLAFHTGTEDMPLGEDEEG